MADPTPKTTAPPADLVQQAKKIADEIVAAALADALAAIKAHENQLTLLPGFDPKNAAHSATATAEFVTKVLAEAFSPARLTEIATQIKELVLTAHSNSTKPGKASLA